MQKETAIRIVARRLGNRTDLDDAILEEMVLAQEYAERLWPSDTLPWFLQKRSSGLATVASSRELSLPTDFLAECENGGLFLTEEAGASPVRLCKSEDIQIWGDATETIPTRYAIIGTKLYFSPIPDAIYPVEMTYYGADTSLLSVSTNKWLQYAPELLISGTGMRLAAYVQNAGVAQLFQQQYQSAVKDLVSTSLQRSLANQLNSLG